MTPPLLRRLSVALCVLFIACSPGAAGTGPSPLPATGTPTSPAASPPVEPTTEPDTAEVFLVVSPSADPVITDSLQVALATLASEASLKLETVNSLPTDLPASARILIGTGAELDLGAASTSHPFVQFLAVAGGQSPGGPNLSTIGASGLRPDQQAFIAGYLAAVVTQDWRSAVVLGPEGSVSEDSGGAFSAGMAYYCGRCSPYFPPYVNYPIVIQVSSYDDPAELERIRAEMDSADVKTVFVPGSVQAGGLLSGLAEAGFNLIGDSPPPDRLGARWIASILPDPARPLQELWPSLMRGEGGASVPMPHVLVGVNAELLSPGRQSEVETLMSDLLAGYVATGFEPDKAGDQ